MPCDQINTATVNLDKADPKLVKAAMDKLHPGANWKLVGGKLTVRGWQASDIDAASIKREMSRQTVIAQAKRFGWSVKEQPDGKLLLAKGRL